MALIMALLVVALLTISVVEFFYSTEVDSRMARNSVHSLQASLLARSGIALGEALLIKDQEKQYDSFLEDWCPAAAREGRACQIEDGAGIVAIPPGMRLRVEIWDESGKINLNWLKPRDAGVANRIRTDKQSANPQRSQIPQLWADALRNLFTARGVNPDAATAVEDYWMQVADMYFPPQATPGTGGAVTTPTAPVGIGTPGTDTQAQTVQQYAWNALWFQSFEEAQQKAIGLSSADLQRLRSFVTAAPVSAQKANINTAPREVLLAIFNDPEIVEDIISRRQSEPIPPQGLQQYNRPAGEDRYPRNPGNLIGVTSNAFLIRASAIVNVNPMTGRGGISRSAEMRVLRVLAPLLPGTTTQVGSRAGAADGTTPTRWTLKRLYWQKEGGAVLFRPEVESGLSDLADSSKVPY